MQVPLIQHAWLLQKAFLKILPQPLRLFASAFQLSLALMSLYIEQECVGYCETPTVQRRSVKYSQVMQIKSALNHRTVHVSLIQIGLSKILSTSCKLVIIFTFASCPWALYIFLVASSFIQRSLASPIQTSLVLEVLQPQLTAKASSNIMLWSGSVNAGKPKILLPWKWGTFILASLCSCFFILYLPVWFCCFSCISSTGLPDP